MSNSYTLINAKDIPGINELYDFAIPVFASECISYKGEPVGLLAGPDPNKLEEYAEECVIKVSENTPAVQIEDSFQKLSYHSDSGSGLNVGNTAIPNLIASGTYNTGIQEHWYTEPHGAAAFYKENKLTVYTATQWPFHVRRSISKMLGITDSSIELIQTQLGFHLDGKLVYPSLLSCQAALAAYLTGKPVKLMLSRIDDFRWSPKRSGSEIQIASALDDKGGIINTEVFVSIDLGAQDIFAKELLSQICLGSLGIYGLGRVNMEGEAKKTAKPPQGPMEGFGSSQGFFAIERHVSRIADSLRQDPAEWRKNNCYSKNANLAIGIALKEEIPMTPLIDSVAAMSDYYRKWASYELLRQKRKKHWELNEHEIKRGIGIAAAFQGSGFLYSGNDKGVYSAELTLEKDGSLIIKTSALVNQEENNNIWRALAKSILGVEETQVSILSTGPGPDSGPASLSRYITAVTRLVERCCEAIRRQRFRDPLPITVRRSIRPDKIIPWKASNDNQSADALAFSRPAWGAAVTEIEIDNVSLKPIIRGIWLVADGGRILSQARARRSLKTAAINALSWATREQVIYENEEIPLETIKNYILPSPEEIPPIHIDFLYNENASPKGIGELPYSCIPASYVQAVSQAMDFPFEKIPLKTEDIWEVKKNKKAELSA